MKIKVQEARRQTRTPASQQRSKPERRREPRGQSPTPGPWSSNMLADTSLGGRHEPLGVEIVEVVVVVVVIVVVVVVVVVGNGLVGGLCVISLTLRAGHVLKRF